MKHPLRLSFLSLCAGLLTGTTFLTPLAADAQLGDGAELAPAAAWPAGLALPEFPICHMPAAAETARGVLRLAQTRTEVPPAEIKAATPAPAFADSDPPLWDGLGSVTYKITTASAEAQAYFDQGLRLSYAFNHGEAQRAFRKAQKLDPACAMCFWGEALVLGPNINLPMLDDAVGPAVAAAEKARTLRPKASRREQELIAALATRYAQDPKEDRGQLNAAYATAMASVAAKFPDDNDIAVLYAEAVMDLSPWDYWQPGGAEPNPQSAPIVPTLERVLANDPNHAGAIHLYIHAVEASDRPQRAEAYADRLRGAIPGAGHLVHMPSHIYYRVGRYLDALADNKTAATVDEKYLADTNAPMGVYRLGYYPHNVHFVLVAAQMAGDGPTVIAAAEKLRGLIPQDIARGIAIAHPVMAAPYFAHAQFSPPETILALPDPGDGIAYAKGIWRYARGIAYVAQRNFDAAAAEATAIAALAREADFSLLKASGGPGQEVMTLAQAVVQGRIAQAQGNFTAALEQFQEAAATQDQLPYMEPPYWYYPVRQTLAAVLLQAGRLPEAEEQFVRALKRAPANGWSYYGLSQVYKARGDTAAVAHAEAELAKTWIGDRSVLQLGNL